LKLGLVVKTGKQLVGDCLQVCMQVRKALFF